MDEEKIIYSKEYEKHENDFLNFDEDEDDDECPMAYISTPSRDSMKKLFIKKCMQFSQAHKISLTVSESHYCIYATFTFFGYISLGNIRPIFLVADDITVAQDEENIIFELAFYTHEPVNLDA